ncbi:MAG: hypothetical protein JNM25_18485 [Planctomycetes bacterium]|nr:hypothetical protein [Planctomycetota bacterium]
MPASAPIRRALALGALSLLTGCAMHTNATRWNGHLGPDGKPVFVLHSQYVGFHLLIAVPFVGSTQVDRMIDESTAWITAQEGDHLRLVETESNNYWYCIPPLSWLLTPVGTSVTFEYRPSASALAAAGYGPDGSPAAAPAH